LHECPWLPPQEDNVLEHPNGSDSVGEAIAHHGRPATTSHDGQNGYSGLIRMADRRAQKATIRAWQFQTAFRGKPCRSANDSSSAVIRPRGILGDHGLQRA
jgi:hypothetical protein